MNYKELFKDRKWLDEVEYQVTFWSNPVYRAPHLPLVLGAGTSSGKTTMVLGHLEMFYADKENKDKKTLLVPSSTGVLRDNFDEALEDFQPKNFNYCIAKTVQEVIDAFNNPDYQVVVALPQALYRIEELPKVEWFILDEAQEWYGKATLNSVISKCNPTYQVLMTGTPAKFHRERDKYLFFHVSVEELYDLGRVGNPRVEVVSTSYDVTPLDFNKSGNLRTDISAKKHKEALWEVAEHMVKHLGLPEMVKKHFLANRATNKILSVFGELDPTIIYCSRTKQANQFYKIFNDMFPGQVLMSHSQNDDDSLEFKEFKEGNHKILISVNRGRIGFDMAELFNIVDFTLTTNVDMLLQLLGRLLRKSKKKKTQKVYYKVASKNDVGYIKLLMTGVLSIWMKDIYSTYSGDAREIRIPRIKPTKPRSPKGDKSPTTHPNVNQRAISNFLEMGVLSLDMWKEVLHFNNDKFATIAWTTLDVVCSSWNGHSRVPTRQYEDCLEVAKKYKRKIDFQVNEPAVYSYCHKEGWIDRIVKDAGLAQRKLTLTYEECKVCADQCKTRTEFGTRFQPKYHKAKKEGWLDEWFGERVKTGPKKGHKVSKERSKKVSIAMKKRWKDGLYDNRDNGINSRRGSGDDNFTLKTK